MRGCLLEGSWWIGRRFSHGSHRRMNVRWAPLSVILTRWFLGFEGRSSSED